jgi:hypothetical protein
VLLFCKAYELLKEDQWLAMAKDPPVFFPHQFWGPTSHPVMMMIDDDDDEDEIQSTQKDGIMLGLSCEKCENNGHLMQ